MGSSEISKLKGGSINRFVRKIYQQVRDRVPLKPRRIGLRKKLKKPVICHKTPIRVAMAAILQRLSNRKKSRHRSGSPIVLAQFSKSFGWMEHDFVATALSLIAGRSLFKQDEWANCVKCIANTITTRVNQKGEKFNWRVRDQICSSITFALLLIMKLISCLRQLRGTFGR